MRYLKSEIKVLMYYLYSKEQKLIKSKSNKSGSNA